MPPRLLLAAFALLPLTAASARPPVAQHCAVPLGGGASAAVRLEQRGGALAAFSMSFDAAPNGSAHECQIAARRGDGRSRWRGDAGATYVSIVRSDVGPLEAVVQRYRGDWQLSVSAPGGGDASCGSFVVPATVIVTPRPNGRCVARLPGRR